MSIEQVKPLPAGSVRLLPSEFKRRSELTRTYMMGLKNENLLQNHYLEAGLQPIVFEGGKKREGETGIPVNLRHFDECHWGWESPTCQVRGQFLGHWLSAAARRYALDGDIEAKARADFMVSELARCQEANGGEWTGSIPEKYLHWIAQGRQVWAPQYTLHKTLMGLTDMYIYAGNDQALDIIEKWSDWFIRWTGQFSREQMDDILDQETGGMLEIWADMYGATGKEQYLDLMSRYERRRLFDPLRAGKDMLTNGHANTTIPEVHGAARAWEVTGDPHWRDVVDAYWKCAVTDRGYFATGGQTVGERWTPPREFARSLADWNQEHCTVYNMMRLANYLFRWTGNMVFADYWERNLYNGILAQQNPLTGLVAYYLPLGAGYRKHWGTRTESFWCCHGTLLQAHTIYADNIFFQQDDDLLISQFIPAEATWQRESGAPVRLALTNVPGLDGENLSDALVLDLQIDCDEPAEFAVRFRLPWWVAGEPEILIDGQTVSVGEVHEGGFVIRNSWHHNRVRVKFPKALTCEPLPDEPDTVAFMDGPVVLAGLTDEGRQLAGDVADPSTILAPDTWRYPLFGGTWRTLGQDPEVRFVPLHDVIDERYAVYFPVMKSR